MSRRPCTPIEKQYKTSRALVPHCHCEERKARRTQSRGNEMPPTYPRRPACSRRLTAVAISRKGIRLPRTLLTPNARPRRLCAVHVVIRGRQSEESPSVETARCIPAPAYSPAVAHRPPDAKKAAIRNRRPFARKNTYFLILPENFCRVCFTFCTGAGSVGYIPRAFI